MEPVVKVHVSEAGVDLEPPQNLTRSQLLAAAEVQLGGGMADLRWDSSNDTKRLVTTSNSCRSYGRSAFRFCLRVTLSL